MNQRKFTFLFNQVKIMPYIVWLFIFLKNFSRFDQMLIQNRTNQKFEVCPQRSAKQAHPAFYTKI